MIATGAGSSTLKAVSNAVFLIRRLYARAMLLIYSRLPVIASQERVLSWLDTDIRGAFGEGPHGLMEWAGTLFILGLLGILAISLGQAAYLFVCVILDLAWGLYL